MLLVDTDTIGESFFKKSYEKYDITESDIQRLAKYRDALDAHLIKMNLERPMKLSLFEESKRVTRFINNYYKAIGR